MHTTVMRRLHGRQLPHAVHARPERLHERRLVDLPRPSGRLSGTRPLPVAEPASRCPEPAAPAAPVPAAPTAPVPITPTAAAFAPAASATFPQPASACGEEGSGRAPGSGTYTAAGADHTASYEGADTARGQHAVSLAAPVSIAVPGAEASATVSLAAPVADPVAAVAIAIAVAAASIAGGLPATGEKTQTIVRNRSAHNLGCRPILTYG